MKSEHEINAEKAAKPRIDLVPAQAILAAARAFAYGVSKHGLGPTGRGTYRAGGNEQSQIATHVASFSRHWNAWLRGQDIDPESGLHELDCAMAQLSIIVDLVWDPPCPQDPPYDDRTMDVVSTAAVVTERCSPSTIARRP